MIKKMLPMACLFLSFNLLAEPRVNNEKRKEGSAQFVTTSGGKVYCTHSQTDLMFTRPALSPLGLEVVNKNTRQTAVYTYLKDGVTRGLENLAAYKKIEGDSSFPNYIGMDRNTYYAETKNDLTTTTDEDPSFFYLQAYNVNSNTIITYCSKK